MKLTGLSSFNNQGEVYSDKSRKGCYTPNFGIANAGKLRILFSYGLPCMYSGIPMLDGQKISGMLKTGFFNFPASKVFDRLSPMKKSLKKIELRAFNILRQNALNQPDKSVQEILQHMLPYHEAQLKIKQFKIFDQIKELCGLLPDNEKYLTSLLMAETEAKINKNPIRQPFHTGEFIYKLNKIKSDIAKREDNKENKVIDKIINEAGNLYFHTLPSNIESQKNVIKFLRIIQKKSALKYNQPLKILLKDSLFRLNNSKLVINFSRKSFIYDMEYILKNLRDGDLKEKIISTARKLPSSETNTSSYIVKYARQPSEKTMYRILWPYIASVEHILPRARGGEDTMSNFGGACTRENSMRSDIDFTEQLKRRPQTPLNCQKYVDRLVLLYRKGVFNKHNIDAAYIKDFANTVNVQSKNQIKLDLTKFEKQLKNSNSPDLQGCCE